MRTISFEHLLTTRPKIEIPFANKYRRSFGHLLRCVVLWAGFLTDRQNDQ